ncbi:unnamed protein product [Prunus brigantina]
MKCLSSIGIRHFIFSFLNLVMKLSRPDSKIRNIPESGCESYHTWVPSPLNKVKFGTLKPGDEVFDQYELDMALVVFNPSFHSAWYGQNFLPMFFIFFEIWMIPLVCPGLFLSLLAKRLIPHLPLLPLASGGNGLGSILLGL